jgi:uncharacterized protein YjbJ (UPF0337 family)
MNSNQVKGTVKDVAGKVQRKVGEATGSAGQQVKGGLRQGEGKAQKALGDAQEVAQGEGNSGRKRR